MTNPPEISPEVPTLAERVSNILQLDPRTIPFFETLFHEIQPTEKTGTSLLSIGRYTLLLQYPLHHLNDHPYQFSVVVLNLLTHKYEAGLVVRVLGGQDQRELFRGITNEHGWCGPSLTIPDPQYPTLTIVVTDETTGDEQITRVKPTIIHKGNPIPAQTHLFLLTDKRLYKPGETLRFVGICWADQDGYYYPLTSKSAPEGLSYRLVNPDGNILFKQNLIPTSYGVVWGSFPIVSNLPEGQYRLQLNFNSNSARIIQEFEVKRYQRPDIEVEVSIASDWWIPLEGEPHAADFSHPLRVNYYYGDPVKEAAVTLQLESIHSHPGWYKARPLEITPPCVLGTWTTDNEGYALIDFVPNKAGIKELLEKYWNTNITETKFKKFWRQFENGTGVELTLSVMITDQQGRTASHGQTVRCALNLFRITQSQIEIDVENNLATYRARLINRTEEPLTGSIQVNLKDAANTVVGVNTELPIIDGWIEVVLSPRASFGLVPTIKLEGTLTYVQGDLEVPLPVRESLGRAQQEEQFTLSVPEDFRLGQPATFTVTSQDYTGPLWVQYGKNEIFAQVSGEISPAGEPFQHTIQIPASAVGTLECTINYFDFGETRAVRSETSRFSVPLANHLLPLAITTPPCAQPGQDLPVEITRDEPSVASTGKIELEPWLLVLKLADKSLRGLDAMTQFDLEAIYDLASKISLQTEPLWTSQMDTILTDLDVMIFTAAKKNQDPNIFIRLLVLNRAISQMLDIYQLGRGLANKYFDAYWQNLLGKPRDVIYLFENIATENLELVSALLGSYFFPESSSTFLIVESLFEALNPYLKSTTPILPALQTLFEYLLLILTNRLETMVYHKEEFRFLEPPLNSAVISLINPLRQRLASLQDLPEELVAPEIREKLPGIAREVNKKGFITKLFLDRNRYVRITSTPITRIAREVELLKEYQLQDNAEILKVILEYMDSAADSPASLVSDDIEFEKDADNWHAIQAMRDFLDNIDRPALKKDVEIIQARLFSEKFYQNLYDNFKRRWIHIKYPEVEGSILKINQRPDKLQREVFCRVVLQNLQKELEEPFQNITLEKLLPAILYNHCYTGRLLEILDLEGLSKSLHEEAEEIRGILQPASYLHLAMEKFFSFSHLSDLLEVKVKVFEEELENWTTEHSRESPQPDLQNLEPLGTFSTEFTPELSTIIMAAIGENQTLAEQIFYEELGKTYLFLLKKGEYWSWRIEILPLIKYIQDAEDFFANLRSTTLENPELYQELQAQIDLIEKEGLFNVFYTTIENTFKINEVRIPNFYEISTGLAFFELGKEVGSPHLSKDRHRKIRGYIAINTLANIDQATLPANPDRSLYQDYLKFQEIVQNCVTILRAVTQQDSPEIQNFDQVTALAQEFEFFWNHVQWPGFSSILEITTNTLNDILHLSSSLPLLKTIFGKLLTFISDQITKKPLLALSIYRTPNHAEFFQSRWKNLLTAFRSITCADQFRPQLDALEYHFLIAQDRITAHFKQIMEQFTRRYIPTIALRDQVWLAMGEQLVIFPNLIGYPKYTSIMTDVGGEDDYRTGGAEAEAMPPDSTGEKKVTVRKRFEDIGYYQVVPVFREPQLKVNIPLPDSITTQELHVAAINESCQMNYQIAEVQVKQEFFIQDDLPEYLTWKDEIGVTVVVTNTTAEALDTQLSIKFEKLRGSMGDPQDGLEFSWDSPGTFTLPPKGINSAHLTLKATRCGQFLVKILADSSHFQDEVQKTIQVTAGFPSDVQQTFEFIQIDPKTSPVEKVYSLDLDTEAIDSRYSLAIFPSLTSHILDGIEANLQYPYGCVEQLFSALMPNLVYYDYLATTGAFQPGSTSNDLKRRLEKNIIGGYLKLQANQQRNGAFGWWRDTSTSPFLTALVLQAYLLLRKHDFLVETWSIRQMADFLLTEAMDSENYSWHVPTGKKAERALSRFSDLTLTAHIIHALDGLRETSLLEANQEFLVQACLDRLLEIDTHEITDCHALSHLLDIFQIHAPERANDLVSQILNYRAGKYWLRGSALGTEVETTARLTKQLWAGQHLPETTRNEILEWIYGQKEPSGGWRTTSDTRAVVQLLTSMLGSETCNLTFTVECNGVPVLDPTRVTLENLSQASYALQNLPLDDAIHKENSQETLELRVQVEGTGSPAFKVVQERWIERPIVPMKGLSIKRTCSATRVKWYKTSDVTLQMTIPPELDEMIVVEEPLLPAALVESDSLDALIRDGIILGYQNIHGNVAFFLPGGRPDVTLTYTLRATRSFHGKLPPATIYPMYAPHARQTGNFTEFVFQRGK